MGTDCLASTGLVHNVRDTSLRSGCKVARVDPHLAYTHVLFSYRVLLIHNNNSIHCQHGRILRIHRKDSISGISGIKEISRSDQSWTWTATSAQPQLAGTSTAARMRETVEGREERKISHLLLHWPLEPGLSQAQPGSWGSIQVPTREAGAQLLQPSPATFLVQEPGLGGRWDAGVPSHAYRPLPSSCLCNYSSHIPAPRQPPRGRHGVNSSYNNSHSGDLGHVK